MKKTIANKFILGVSFTFIYTTFVVVVINKPAMWLISGMILQSILVGHLYLEAINKEEK